MFVAVFVAAASGVPHAPIFKEPYFAIRIGAEPNNLNNNDAGGEFRVNSDGQKARSYLMAV